MDLWRLVVASHQAKSASGVVTDYRSLPEATSLSSFDKVDAISIVAAVSPFHRIHYSRNLAKMKKALPKLTLMGQDGRASATNIRSCKQPTRSTTLAEVKGRLAKRARLQHGGGVMSFDSLISQLESPSIHATDGAEVMEERHQPSKLVVNQLPKAPSSLSAVVVRKKVRTPRLRDKETRTHHLSKKTPAIVTAKLNLKAEDRKKVRTLRLRDKEARTHHLTKKTPKIVTAKLNLKAEDRKKVRTPRLRDKEARTHHLTKKTPEIVTAKLNLKAEDRKNVRTPRRRDKEARTHHLTKKTPKIVTAKLNLKAEDRKKVRTLRLRHKEARTHHLSNKIPKIVTAKLNLKAEDRKKVRTPRCRDKEASTHHLSKKTPKIVTAKLNLKAEEGNKQTMKLVTETMSIPSQNSILDLYGIIGLSGEAVPHPRDIASNYKFAAKRAHPDKGGSTEAMQRLALAKEVLMDPRKRIIYDREKGIRDDSGRIPHCYDDL